jgi:protein-disulfide isomerase
MRITFDNILAVLLVACAGLTTALVARREFTQPPAARSEQKPVFIQEWQQHLAKGFRMGPAEAPVQLLEFADLECPYCATLHRDLKALGERYPTQVAWSYVHFPLPMHRFAEPAARAAECAGNQGRFAPMLDVLYEQQHEFGLKPWSEMAKEAGVVDLGTFETCVLRKDVVPRVAAGKELGKVLDLKGTPTLLVNGWKLGRTPSLDGLDAMVKAILAGNSPVGEKDR